MTPIAVIIPTFNEEANIGHAIASVKGWARQIFLVDSYSTDNTIDVALSTGGDRVQVVQHPFESYSAQWNWAIEELPITQPWIMKLDADERATTEFRDEVSAALDADDSEIDAYVVHWRLVFMGRWLRHGGLYPNGNVRIWRTGKATCENRDVNEHLIVDGNISHIKAPIDHHDNKSISHWIDRHNRYSSMEAKSLLQDNLTGDLKPRLIGQPDERRMWLRRLYYRLPFRPALYFAYRYFLRLGLLDGLTGFRFSFLHACFLYWIDLKRKEFAVSGSLPEVMWPARGKPHPRICNSPLQKLVDEEALTDREDEPSDSNERKTLPTAA